MIDDKVSSFPELIKCETFFGTMQTTWHFSQNDSIISTATDCCLEVVKANIYFCYLLVLQLCSGQKWTIKNKVIHSHV